MGGISIEKKVVVVARNKHVAGKTRFSSVTFKMRSRKILTLKRNLNSSYTHVSRIYGFLRWEIKQHIDAFLKDKVIFIQKNSSGEILPLFSSNLNSVTRYLSTYFLLDEYTKKIYAILTYFSLKTKKKLVKKHQCARKLA